MITQPLTSTEEESLRQTKRRIKTIHSEFEEHILIEINNNNKETWLNILSLAERANEIITEQWRSKHDSKVTF